MTFRHFYILLLSTLMLTACTPPTFWQDKQQRQSFTEALDLYLSTDERSALETLAAREPSTPWSQKAQQLLNRLDTLEQHCLSISEELETNKKNYNNQLQLLQQENKDLKETMEQLKQLFIDMELRE